MIRFQVLFIFIHFSGFEQVSYIDPDRKIASSLGTNGTELKDIGVVMTAGGANNELSFLKDDKGGENLLSIASNGGGRSPSNDGYKILLEQAMYEMTRGSYSVALEYLNRAVQVTTNVLYIFLPFSTIKS